MRQAEERLGVCLKLGEYDGRMEGSAPHSAQRTPVSTSLLPLSLAKQCTHSPSGSEQLERVEAWNPRDSELLSLKQENHKMRTAIEQEPQLLTTEKNERKVLETVGHKCLKWENGVSGKVAMTAWS